MRRRATMPEAIPDDDEEQEATVADKDDKPESWAFQHWRRTVHWVWLGHGVLSGGLLVVVGQMTAAATGEQKWLPLDPHTVGRMMPLPHHSLSCTKAYANVWASTVEEGLLCCHDDHDHFLCTGSPAYLKRSLQWMTKVPTCFFLPLLPLLCRILVLLLVRRSRTPKTTSSRTKRTTTAISLLDGMQRRLYLYAGVTVFRGVILYLLFDTLENFLVEDSTTMTASSCWYDAFVPHQRRPCAGSVFDYSDHIVLYFAQVIPIALVEVIFSFVEHDHYQHQEEKEEENSTPTPTLVTRVLRVQQLFLVLGFLYLYGLVVYFTYTTVTYYHTYGECLVAYLISMIVQLPLYLLTTNTSSAFWRTLRTYFFAVS